VNSAPEQVYDAARLAAVARTGLLDTEPEEAFDRLARLAAELLGAPLAFVTIVDDRRSFWKAGIGVAAGSGRQHPVEDSFGQYVIGTGEPLIVGDARANPLTAKNPSIASLGVRAWAGFPVVSPDDQILGTFCVVDTVTRTWTERDVRILEVLSRAASGEVALRISVDEARQAVQRAEAASEEASRALAVAERAAEDSALLAKTLQLSLLPPTLPAVPGLELAAAYHPGGRGSEVLGDFYDIVPSVRGTWSAFVGDVCGKGPEAAKTTALARYTLRAAALVHSSPAHVLGNLNPALVDWFAAQRGQFVTLAYTTLRRGRTGYSVRLATAGHEPIVVRRRDGIVEFLHTPNMPLGILGGLGFAERRFVLRPGESMLLFTDGVTEARAPRSHEQFGVERVQKILESASAEESAQNLVTRLHDAVLEFGGAVTSDDIAILAVRVPPSR
jgi:sigma-B regulation protein RsbU (phosphoserine phosphatase)